MPAMTVTRKQLRLAIREGILRSPRLTTAECAALNRVGRTASSFGSNFDTGCPAILAGLTRPDAIIPERIWAFTRSFDRQMIGAYVHDERVLVDG